MRLIAALLFCLLIASAAAGAPATPPQGEGSAKVGALRLSQVRDASDETLVQLVFGRLAAFPYPGIRDGLEHRRHGESVDLWFYSEARATDRAGICGSDRLIVSLERVDGFGSDNPLLRPAGFNLETYYIVENEAEARRTRANRAREVEVRDAACKALDPRRDATQAQSPAQLMSAIELTEQVGREALTGRLSVPFVCNPESFYFDAPADEAGCLALVAGFGRNHVRAVSDCRPRRETAGGCIRILSRGVWLEFDLTSGQSLARVVIEDVEEDPHGW